MRFMNPFKDFSLDEVFLEVRFDPLTGQTSRVLYMPYEPPARPALDDLVKRSREIFCPFCPDTLEKSTPLYPKELVPEGRIIRREACLVPNPMPLDRYTGVCVVSRSHYIAIEDLTAEILRDPFIASWDFVKTVAAYDLETNYFNINWNYMFPAGSSLVHPHIQVNCGVIPTYQHRVQIESSIRYFMENGREFWSDYLETEREIKERFIADIGPTSWTLSFAPHSILPDLWCIFPGHSSLLEIKEDDLDPFLRGLAGAIRYFDAEGLFSFNMSIFSGRESEHFRLNARISPRLLLREIGNSDHTYVQFLHREHLCFRAPESVREKVLDAFGKN
jgi:galactose-1-phosphate uridylyltransferase